jgi:hypothetical protein
MTSKSMNYYFAKIRTHMLRKKKQRRQSAVPPTVIAIFGA